MCHLEVVVFEFISVGYEERPRREDQAEHTRQSTQKHIALTATATIKTREVVQLKLDDKVQTLHTTIEFQQQKLQDQDQQFEVSMQSSIEQYHNQQQEIVQMQKALLVKLEEKKKKIQQLFADLCRLMSVQNKTEEAFQRLKMLEELPLLM